MDDQPNIPRMLFWASLLSAMLWGLIALIIWALFIVLTSNAHAQTMSPSQSLLYATPMQHGTMRDLTHTPALPFIQPDVTNLQQQMWAQPGTAMNPRFHGGYLGPEDGPTPNLLERTNPLGRAMETYKPDWRK